MIKAHIKNQQIFGYYNSEWDYGANLPPESELVEITDEQHQALLAVNAWGMAADGTPIAVDPNYVAPPPPPPPTLDEKLAALGLTKAELKQALLAK